jgi:hypothetical protein
VLKVKECKDFDESTEIKVRFRSRKIQPGILSPKYRTGRSFSRSWSIFKNVTVYTPAFEGDTYRGIFNKQRKAETTSWIKPGENDVVEEIRNMFCQIDAKITTADKKVEKDAEEMKYPRQENERLERKIKEQDERLKW